MSYFTLTVPEQYMDLAILFLLIPAATHRAGHNNCLHLTHLTNWYDEPQCTFTEDVTAFAFSEKEKPVMTKYHFERF